LGVELKVERPDPIGICLKTMGGIRFLFRPLGPKNVSTVEKTQKPFANTRIEECQELKNGKKAPRALMAKSFKWVRTGKRSGFRA